MNLLKQYDKTVLMNLDLNLLGLYISQEAISQTKLCVLDML